MKIDDIISEWEKDCIISQTDLGEEALKSARLHQKYYEILIRERLLLRKIDSEFKELKLQKFEFYKDGHTEETVKKGWTLPPKGMILKTDIPMYMDADKEIINISLKIGLQQEKIEFLESIIKTLMNRGYLIRNAIDFLKFQMGS